ncbi:MAG: TetR/AcrR family transcriptional regulator [Burkholderiales bacterium]|nr:TetR/AcrR family transcriptional regulator [Burkholderiales bacterium]
MSSAAPARPVPVSRGPAATRVRLSGAERRREIVLAVVELARDAGPEGITTQAIAERVGVTHGALFRHFPDKDAIWAAVFDWVRQTLGEIIDAAFAVGSTPMRTLEGVFLAHVGFVARYPGVTRILYHELQRPGPSSAQSRVRTMVGGYRQRLCAAMAAAREAGELPASLDEEAAAVLLIGTVQGLAVQSTLFGGEGGMLEAARRLWPLLLDGFRGAGSSSSRGAPASRRPGRTTVSG